METHEKAYSAIDLLDKVFEFTEMTPNSNEWNLHSLRSNPPRQVRLHQINAMLSAFCLIDANQSFLNKTKSMFSETHKTPIDSFLQGDFIKKRTINEYENLIQIIKDFVNSKDALFGNTRDITVGELAFIFPKLVSFKRLIRSLLTYNSGWLEASSTPAIFSIYLTDSISINLVDKYDQLDKVLKHFICPKLLTFTQSELIAKFSFPIENLNDLDIELA